MRLPSTAPLFAAIFVASNVMAQVAPHTDAASDYKLVWSDEFNADGPPDPKNWTFERGFVRNEELQLYQPENARCESGLLVIEARRERVDNPRFREGARGWQQSRQFAQYTSACLLTRGLHEWRYGRFEMRGRIDTRPGLWPAWWTLGRARGWPGGGEIDIMEYYNGDLLANVAWLGSGTGRQRTKWDDFKKPVRTFPDADWPKKFHTWRMDWTPESIKLFVDDELLNETDLKQTINGDTEAANPFHEPQYMLLNLAIGGTRGGDPTNTEFPARLEVDYVRVYQHQ
jgi:beta-glucanase (GH16 family)